MTSRTFTRPYLVRNRNSPLLGETGVIEAYLRHRHDLAPQTLLWYGGLLGRFTEWLMASGIEPIVASVNVEIVESYLEARHAAVSAQSVRCDVIVLRSFSKYLGERILKTVHRSPRSASPGQRTPRVCR